MQTVQKCHFCQFQRFWILIFSKFEHLTLATKIQSSLEFSRVAKINIFGLFEFANIWFHVKSEWRKNDQISTKSSLNFTFWKFLEHSDLKALRFCCNQHQKCRTDGFIKLINQENWFFIPISRKTCNVGPFETREVNIQLPNSIHAIFLNLKRNG